MSSEHLHSTQACISALQTYPASAKSRQGSQNERRFRQIRHVRHWLRGLQRTSWMSTPSTSPPLSCGPSSLHATCIQAPGTHPKSNTLAPAQTQVRARTNCSKLP
jgi:hypothetical protein